MAERSDKSDQSPQADRSMAAVVNRNIEALLERRQAAERSKLVQDRIAEGERGRGGSPLPTSIGVIRMT